MPDLYVTDLDGTLLRSAGTVGPVTAELLNPLLAGGLRFTCATARSWSSARTATSVLDLRLPMIVYGGAMLCEARTGAVLETHPLTPGDVRILLEVVAATAAAPILISHEEGRDWVRWDPGRSTPGVAEFLRTRQGDRRLRPITEADPLDLSRVLYVSVLAPSEVAAELSVQAQERLGCVSFVQTDPATPGLTWFEAHSAEATKAAAVERLQDRLGVGRLTVFGDNVNDLPMFEIADHACAVANAVASVRAVATTTIGSCDDDAVARWVVERVAGV